MAGISLKSLCPEMQHPQNRRSTRPRRGECFQSLKIFYMPIFGRKRVLRRQKYEEKVPLQIFWKKNAKKHRRKFQNATPRPACRHLRGILLAKNRVQAYFCQAISVTSRKRRRRCPAQVLPAGFAVFPLKSGNNKLQKKLC